MSHLPEREDDGGVTSDIEVRLAGLAPEQRDPAQLRLAGTARPAEERLVGPSFTEEQLWFVNRLEPRLEVVGGDRDVISLGGPPFSRRTCCRRSELGHDLTRAAVPARPFT